MVSVAVRARNEDVGAVRPELLSSSSIPSTINSPAACREVDASTRDAAGRDVRADAALSTPPPPPPPPQPQPSEQRDRRSWKQRCHRPRPRGGVPT